MNVTWQNTGGTPKNAVGRSELSMNGFVKP